MEISVRKTAVCIVAFMGSLVGGLALTGDVAHADVATATAYVEVDGACVDGAAAVSYWGDFDYSQLWTYDAVTGWDSFGWERGSNGVPARFSPSGAAFAVYAQFAEWNGYSWDYAGQWVLFVNTNSYWC